jgi:glycosyltransferase involved in cell wall biosynthesis
VTSNTPKVLIAVLSTFERNGWHHPSITEFIYTLRFQMDYATSFVPVHAFQPAASGRNVICKFFRDNTDADWICMIDNDMRLPDNILDTIKDAPADAGVIAPMFYLWDESIPAVKLCLGIDRDKIGIIRKDGRDYVNLKDAPRHIEIFKCGTGVIFIHRSALETLPYPWFKYRYNEDQGMIGTEDIWFCDQAREAGIKMYGNTKISVGHFHNVNLKVVADLVYRDYVPAPQNPLDKKDASAVPSPQTEGRSPEVPASVSST